MDSVKKLAFAVIAAIGLSGCASTQIAQLAGAEPAPAPVAEQKVLRALPSYGAWGGYRHRRFAAVAAAS